MKWIFLIINDIFRSKVRSFLTILGVAIGIYAMVVMGALAENLNNMVDSAKNYMGGVIHVVTKTNKKGQNPGVSAETLKKIRSIPEVKSLSPFLILLLDGFDLEKRPLTFFTPQFTVGGIENLEILKSGRQRIKLLQGRWLNEKDTYQALVNQRLFRKRNLKLGGFVTIRKKKYTVVGLISLPNIPAAPDAFIPYERLKEDFQEPSTEYAQKLIEKYLPKGTPLMFDTTRLAKQIVGGLHGRYYPYYAIPWEGVDPEVVVEKIHKIAPEVAAIPPKKLIQEVENAMMLFTLIMLCIGFISSVVAGLLIINTLVMSILERKKEIGIKMAIGASKAQIIGEFIGESAVIGVIGGLIGITGGLISILVANPWIIEKMETGQPLFMITPRLVLGSFLFALVLSCLAGIYPAYRASTLDPVETLRNL